MVVLLLHLHVMSCMAVMSCRRKTLMGGQMKRWLRKPGKIIGNAMTLPLLITSRYALSTDNLRKWSTVLLGNSV